MNLLVEIPDGVIAIAGIIVVLIIVIISIIVKVSNRKIKPISEDDRYDNDEIHVEKIEPEDLTDEQKKAKEELEKVFNQMNADLENQKPTPDDIDVFEREQEENAIISYQELMTRAEKLKKEADRYENELEDQADMRMTEAISAYEKKERKKAKSEEKKQYKSFRSSDIVSPIYGIQSNKNMIRQKNSSKKQNSDIISEAYEKERFEREETQNLDFLNSLKEFRNKL